MKHYYNIEVVSSVPLDEEEIEAAEELLKKALAPSVKRVSTEYVDSEG